MNLVEDKNDDDDDDDDDHFDNVLQTPNIQRTTIGE
jgi:hypothetical protein